MNEVIEDRSWVEMCIDDELYDFYIEYVPWTKNSYYEVTIRKHGPVRSWLWFKWSTYTWDHYKWFGLKEFDRIWVKKRVFITPETAKFLCREVIESYKRKLKDEELEEKEFSKLKIIDSISCT